MRLASGWLLSAVAIWSSMVAAGTWWFPVTVTPSMTQPLRSGLSHGWGAYGARMHPAAARASTTAAKVRVTAGRSAAHYGRCDARGLAGGLSEGQREACGWAAGFSKEKSFPVRS